MNDSTSAQLFDHGAFFILLDFEPGGEFGIDWNSWTTDEKFKGVKLIPPGVHFIYYCVKNTKSPEQSPRSGFFHSFKKKEVLIRRWDEEKGCPVPVDSLTETNLQLPENLKNLDNNLGAYPYESYKQWCGLSNFITGSLIDQLQPKSGRIDSVVNFTPDVDENNRTKIDREGLPILHRDETDRFGFADIGRRWWPSDCTAQERTEYAQKSDWIFNHLKEERGVAALKGEFQFAYLTFILGQVMIGFDHWKQLLRIICHVEQPEVSFIASMSSILYFQMKTMPEDFMVDIVSSNNVVLQCLNRLFKNVHQYGLVSESVKAKLSKFRAFCEKKFDWKFYEDGESSEEDDDDRPVVVELP